MESDMPFNVAQSGWESTTLGEVAARGGGNVQTGPFGSQLHAADYVEHGIPSIMPQNIGDNRINIEGIARITEADADRLSKYRVATGDVIYSRRGDVEKCALIREENDGWLCGTGCLRVRFGEGHVIPEYAAYFLSHPSIRGWIVNNAVGATMPNLNTKILSSVPFAVPSLQEQTAIAETLGALDDRIEANRRTNETLEAMARAVFRDWFVDFGPTRRQLAGASDPHTILGGLIEDEAQAHRLAALFPATFGDNGLPEGWEKRPLSEICNFKGGSAFKKDDQGRKHGDVPFIKVSDMNLTNNERFILSAQNYVNIADQPRMKFTLHAEGAVVLAKIGIALTYNRLRVLQTPTAIDNNLLSATPLTGAASTASLFMVLSQIDFNLHAKGSALPYLNASDLAKIEFQLGSNALVAEIECIIAPLFDKILANSKENRTLAATRDLLLPKLMSGDIRLKDAEGMV